METLVTVVNTDKAFVFAHTVSFRLKYYNIFKTEISNKFFYAIFISFLG